MNSNNVTPNGQETASPIRVLLAEDEAHLGNILEQYLVARGFDVTMARNGRVALELLRSHAFDVALLDIVMPEIDGLEVLRLVREDPLPPEIIVITGNGTIETAMAALKLGAYDFLSKPYRMAEIDALVRRAWEKRMLIRDNTVLRDRLRAVSPSPRFVTQYAPLMAVMALIGRTAPSASPVLVQGDEGTGKRLLARVIHEQSGRESEPFVAVDCRTVRGDSALATLFGIEGDTGDSAQRRQTGVFEAVGRGTLYLEHVDQLPPAVQESVARMFATGTFSRVGSTQPIAFVARLVASTTRDLSRLVTQREFREDVLHHISAIRVVLPPLRERLTDVTKLAQYFVQQCGGGRPATLTNDALSALERYRWPGNVSELRAVVERAVLLASDHTIQAHDLALMVETRSAADTGANRASMPGSPEAAPTMQTLEAIERQHVEAVLEFSQWHQGRAADILGISPKTLYRKIREFGFKRPSGRG